MAIFPLGLVLPQGLRNEWPWGDKDGCVRLQMAGWTL